MNITALMTGLGVVGILILSGCGKPPPPPADRTDYGSARDQVVQQLKTGQIKANPAGIATLPPEFQSASIDGQVIAGQTPAHGWVVAFPLQHGRAAVQCFLYVEKSPPPGSQSLQVGALTFTLAGHAEGQWHQATLVSR